jgi:hypothetical protein
MALARARGGAVVWPEVEALLAGGDWDARSVGDEAVQRIRAARCDHAER